MSSIEDRLRRLEDERDILRTLYTYGHAIDYGYEEEFVDCWAEDALLFWPVPGEIRGRDAIREAFRIHTHAPDVIHKHLLIEPLISIEGDHATVDSMLARLDPYEGIPEIRAFGRYRDKFVRCPDGKWRFQERRAEVEAWRTGSPPAVPRDKLDAALARLAERQRA